MQLHPAFYISLHSLVSHGVHSSVAFIHIFENKAAHGKFWTMWELLNLCSLSIQPQSHVAIVMLVFTIISTTKPHSNCYTCVCYPSTTKPHGNCYTCVRYTFNYKATRHLLHLYSLSLQPCIHYTFNHRAMLKLL